MTEPFAGTVTSKNQGEEENRHATFPGETPGTPAYEEDTKK